ncbi:hypothetical protein QBC38DRAFT_179389 [Podospora fimiseda]|uniref:Microbial-type PARG catalytic domain-containing protein n=1 Tax=Podospora fimiseda TaxID=252190 RepID=A0AAN7H865_9PEZI|nr:hypothetical protein QBC38DRAFT_179389 [Podospora fimiseda]
MPPSSSKSSKPKPSEVASETKKVYIPHIKRELSHKWPLYSSIYHQPHLLPLQERGLDVSPPQFYVYHGDPVNTALDWVAHTQNPIPFICAANDRRPGGDWETGAVGYEERLCRRSTLAANLSTPASGAPLMEHYPIPVCSGILSPNVVVFRGPHDKYEKLPEEQWQCLPVISVPPPRWPKLTSGGTKYSFADERELVKDKLRVALSIVAYAQYDSVVIGDFGLGNGYRNPPKELAELWREVLLYDPNLRGRFNHVMFVFEDPYQCTEQLILDDIAKKAKSGSGSSSSRSKSKSSSSGSSSSSCTPSNCHTDYQIFQGIFDKEAIQRHLAKRDARYGINNLLVS